MSSVVQFQFKPTKYSPVPYKVDILPDTCGFVVYDLFSKEECQQIINTGESNGFQPLSKEYNPSYRNNKRILCNIPNLTSEWWNRVSPFINETLLIGKNTDTLASNFLTTGVWKKSELNPQLRLCKYDPGNFFKKHYDEGYHPDMRKKRTMKTCMLYLNENFEGGSTTFYYRGETYSIQPKTGMCLVFDQQILHEGMTVTSGLKYFVRTDIYYDLVKNIQTNSYSKVQLQTLEEFHKYVCLHEDGKIEESFIPFKKAEKLYGNIETLYYYPNSQFPEEKKEPENNTKNETTKLKK